MNSKIHISPLKRGTLDYVFAHGNWRIKRGKNVSAKLPGEPNPKKAYLLAKAVCDIGSQEKKPQAKAHRPMFNRRGQTQLEEYLGIAPPHEEPWYGARKVPNTCYEWY